MGFIKKQMLKVIEWKDDSTDVIVQRFDIPDRYEIMKGSQLTVRESQACIFVNEGKIADVFGPGRNGQPSVPDCHLQLEIRV